MAERSTSRSIVRSLKGQPGQVVPPLQHFPVMRLKLSAAPPDQTHRVPAEFSRHRKSQRTQLYQRANQGIHSRTSRSSTLHRPHFPVRSFPQTHVLQRVCTAGSFRFRTSRSSVLCRSAIKTGFAPHFPVKRIGNDLNASNLSTIHLWSPHFS